MTLDLAHNNTVPCFFSMCFSWGNLPPRKGEELGETLGDALEEGLDTEEPMGLGPDPGDLVDVEKPPGLGPKSGGGGTTVGGFDG